jgi:hypothetical protein
MSDTRLSPSEIFQIFWDVRDGTADPEAVALLLRDYCERFDHGEDIPRLLQEYLRDSFAAYLSGERNIDVALGLKRAKRGPKRVDNAHIAVEILRERLQGSSYEDAVAVAEKRCHRERSVVQKAWSEHKCSAVSIVRNERPYDSHPWTVDEEARLREIFKNDPFLFENAPSLTRPDD